MYRLRRTMFSNAVAFRESNFCENNIVKVVVVANDDIEQELFFFLEN